MKFNLDPSDILIRAKRVQLLILDVDGVMTAGELYLNDSGQEIKAFSTLDGQGIKLLQSMGIQVGIISGRKSALVASRAKNLGIEILFQGREDKGNALAELCQDCNINADSIAYIGDDLPDIKVMKAVNLSFAVANAHSAVKDIANAQTTLAGGHGAVREVCDFILEAQGKYEAALEPFL